METRQSAHPSKPHLAAMALGKLAPESQAALQAHVSNCPGCRRFLDETPPEALAAIVRQAQVSPKPADQATRSAQVQRVTHTSLAANRASDSAAHGAVDDSIPPELRSQRKYRIERLLGRGGMGSVYHARHEMMGREVALKVINPELVNNPEALLRFEQEVKTLARLDHPNIARTFDAESFGSLQVVVVELVRGQTLHELLKKRGRLTVKEACRCVRQACLGLQHVHDRGLVHRDLKPQNLMLTEDKGIIKILDFGLAKVVGQKNAARGLTQTNVTMGTYEYMSPEQAMDAASADIRADIYSLGCTLYYLIAGQLPFNNALDVQLLLAHQSETPRPLCEVVPETPKELSDLVNRMLAKKPEDRPQTPRGVAQALLPFAKGENPLESRPQAASAAKPAKAGTPARAERAFAALLAAISKHLKRPVVLVGLSAAAVAALVLFAVLMSIRTSEGMVQIELKDPPADVQVSVDQNAIDIRGLGQPLRLKVGEHGLEVRSGNFETFTQQFTVKTGETGSVTVTLVPKKQLAVSKTTAVPPEPPRAKAPFDGKQAAKYQQAWAKYLGKSSVSETNSIGMKLALIPPGEFMMGSPKELTEREFDEHKPLQDWFYMGRSADETPEHQVRITKPFWLGETCVTQEEYEQVMGKNPSAFTDKQLDPSAFSPALPDDEIKRRLEAQTKMAGKDTKRHPVETVTWDDAMEFCRRLSEQPAEKAAHRRYCLPTEAQWEYACRAGTKTRWFSGDDEAEFAELAGLKGDFQTQAVGETPANSWGLHEMGGIVWQWCQDFHDPVYYSNSPTDDPTGPSGGSVHVIRGGTWVFFTPWTCRSAFRCGGDLSHYCLCGLRVAIIAESDSSSPEKPPIEKRFSEPREQKPPFHEIPENAWTEWKDLFDGKTLDGWKQETQGQFGEKGPGSVKIENGCIELAHDSWVVGIATTESLPRTDYEIQLEVMRISGNTDFASLFFPIGEASCNLILGGYPSNVVGLNRVDGKTHENNVTTRHLTFESNNWYTVRLRVTNDRIQAWIGTNIVIDLPRAGREFSGARLLTSSWDGPLGIYAWGNQGPAESRIRSIRIRQLKASTGASKIETPPAPHRPEPSPPRQDIPENAWTEWKDLFDGKTLNGWKQETEGSFALNDVKGSISIENVQMKILREGYGAVGIAATGTVPRTNYEVEVEAKRVYGDFDFASLHFPVGDECCTLMVGARGDVVALDTLDGKRGFDNETTYHASFSQDSWYKVKLRVTDDRIQAWIGENKVIDLTRDGRVFGLDWENSWDAPLGIYAYENMEGTAESRIRAIRIRQLKAAAGMASKPKEPNGENPAPHREIDLLKTVDPAKDAVSGTWRKVGETLTCEQSTFARIELPYDPPKEYDFRLAFKSNAADRAVISICRGGDNQFGFIIGGLGNTRSSFSEINGDNGTRSVADRWLVPGQRHVSLVKVRADGVQGWFDNKLIAEHKTNFSDMSCGVDWKLRRTDCLGIATNTDLTIESATVTEIAGEGKKLRD